MAAGTKRLAPVIVAGLAALAPSAAVADARVFACEPEWAALAEEVGGGGDVVAYAATHGRQDPHYIRARPSLIAQVRRADIVFCSGAELEIGWLPVLMGARRRARRAARPAGTSDGGRSRGSPGSPRAGRPQPRRHPPERQPRMSISTRRNLARLATELAGRLARVDPGNAAAYRARLADFQARWSAATERWGVRAERLSGMKSPWSTTPDGPI